MSNVAARPSTSNDGRRRHPEIPEPARMRTDDGDPDVNVAEISRLVAAIREDVSEMYVAARSAIENLTGLPELASSARLAIQSRLGDILFYLRSIEDAAGAGEAVGASDVEAAE